MSLPAQSVPANNTTDGVIKSVNLIQSVVATRHAPFPGSPQACVFQTQQVRGDYCVRMCIFCEHASV